MRTIQKLAQEALDVQNACNLSGVVHGFSRAITDLREALTAKYPQGVSTGLINHHPICVLWADKIASLTGIQGLNDPSTEAYQEVYKLAGSVPTN